MPEAFAPIQQHGYNGVEISPFTISKWVTDISADTRRKVRDAAQKAELEVIGIHWVLVGPEGLHISHPDEPVRQKTENYLVELVRFCADVGGKIIVFGSPAQRNVLEGMTYEQAWDGALKSFRPMCDEAAEHGVTICMEPLARSITNFINTAEEAVRFVRTINHPNLKIILDCFSMGDEAKPREVLLRENASYLAHVHANDVNKLGPGMAENGVDFRKVGDALQDIGYQGYVSVEVFDFTPGADVIASKSIEHLRATMG
jgi:sugar phosphate isomerase/epimerase